jgi:hypothetical protein
MAGTQGKQGESGISRGAEDPDASNTPSTEEGLEFVAETPTEANHANSVPAPGKKDECETPPPDLFSGPGSYRMVRPAVSDRIAAPAPVAGKADKNRGGRVVIGVARKPG